MRNFRNILLLSTLMLLLSCGSSKEVYMFTSFHEPATEGLRYLYSSDGCHWDSIPDVWLQPSVGKQKVMRDPSMLRTADGTYHLVWTSSWRGDRGFGYAESKDLIHWSQPRFVEVMEDTSTVNVWAPEWFYDDKRQEAMVVWASCVPYKFEKGIEDEKNNHRLYYSTTKDFKTFTPGRLLCDAGYSCIDATFVKKGNNDYVMVVKDNTRPMRNLRISFASDPHGPWSQPSEPFTPEFVEGPSVAHTSKGYIVYCDRYRMKDFGAYLTNDFIHFTDISKDVRVPQLHKHGTIFKAPQKDLKRLLKSSKGK